MLFVFRELTSRVEENLGSVLSVLSDLEKTLSLDKLSLAEHKFSAMHVGDAARGLAGEAIHEDVVAAMAASYESSLAQLRDVVQKKLAYIKQTGAE